MTLELWHYLLLAAAGTIGGFLNVIAGGGSLVMMPVMVFMGIPGPVANGTNRIALLIQNIVAITTFRQRGYSDWRLSLSLAACSIPGALLGAWYGTQLEGVWFNRVLAAVMIGVLLLTWFGPSHNEREPMELTTRRRVAAHALMLLIGAYGGFIQIGVGFLIMPILNRVLGLDLVRVNMHKVFIVFVYMLASLAVYASRVEILWLVGLVLALGTSLGAWLGAHLTITRGEPLIKLVLNVVIVAFVIRLLTM